MAARWQPPANVGHIFGGRQPRAIAQVADRTPAVPAIDRDFLAVVGARLIGNCTGQGVDQREAVGARSPAEPLPAEHSYHPVAAIEAAGRLETADIVSGQPFDKDRAVERDGCLGQHRHSGACAANDKRDPRCNAKVHWYAPNHACRVTAAEPLLDREGKNFG